jgi:hypothetical protein
MTIETKTDAELIKLWDELTGQMNSGATAVGATHSLRVLSTIHKELAERGYRPENGVWVKAETNVAEEKPQKESEAK